MNLPVSDDDMKTWIWGANLAKNLKGSLWLIFLPIEITRSTELKNWTRGNVQLQSGNGGKILIEIKGMFFEQFQILAQTMDLESVDDPFIFYRPTVKSVGQ